ncbi:unnamed protein product [Bursaphelenchus okinawaensis]|uniref:Uncharacterized protein n=1 Tax=Bursaphelenchus okinawaensis TaxID=465554 RepID=A0A811LAM4_9BILA|nr:unnamed protein product [Bursaphelenchus okinawaensis]CAG9122119.1 unnamed protein product [Bursaphelenchus okinawaensis]
MPDSDEKPAVKKPTKISFSAENLVDDVTTRSSTVRESARSWQSEGEDVGGIRPKAGLYKTRSTPLRNESRRQPLRRAQSR